MLVFSVFFVVPLKEEESAQCIFYSDSDRLKGALNFFGRGEGVRNSYSYRKMFK